jgi:membrane protease YdiL (CAAX protease family)
MTAISLPGIAQRSPGAAAVRSIALVTGLAVIVWLRWAATVAGIADALSIGLAFGLALTALALAGGQVVRRPRPVSLVVGLGGGAALAALALVTHLGTPGPSLAPAAAFAPWALITILVATAEELVLRGVVFGALLRQAGVAVAVLVTSIAFALIHVPLYGWHVVPLDLGVGIWLAGLRLLTGGVAAPATAHAVADLVTWSL